MSKENKVIKELKDKLLYERKNLYLTMTAEEQSSMSEFCEGYKAFLDAGKTERTACTAAIALAEKAGFVPYNPHDRHKAGDKVYSLNRGKAVIFAVIGGNPVECGVNIIASHIDSPRVDLKQNPLFEDNDLAYFKTHYYGGIKKYQWTAVPLALYGVVVKADGSCVDVVIGEDESDPVFTVTDLLPHLAEQQYKRPANELIKGEEINILIGSRPYVADGESGGVKLEIMRILNEKYGIVERDFATAEFEAVPNYKARDIGFDRSIVGGYGQDDRVCAYTSLEAILKTESPARTAVCILADKEEVGSYGSTGLGSCFFEHFMENLVGSLSDGKGGKSLRYRQCLANSKCLSADVCAAFDPTFPDVSEKKNCAYMNCGTIIAKYFGSRGKVSTNDASAEFLGEVRKIYDQAGVAWQTGELGKVDAGGGGTVAMFLARLNIDTVDVGVPLLSMHAPMELSAKSDVYMCYKGFKAFYAYGQS